MPEVACHNCVGACCHDRKLPLRQREVNNLQAAGTILSLIHAFDDGDGGMYQMTGDCAYLDRTTEYPTCKIHEQPDQPIICKGFKPSPNNSACVVFRAMDGIVQRIK